MNGSSGGRESESKNAPSLQQFEPLKRKPGYCDGALDGNLLPIRVGLDCWAHQPMRQGANYGTAQLTLQVVRPSWHGGYSGLRPLTTTYHRTEVALVLGLPVGK